MSEQNNVNQAVQQGGQALGELSNSVASLRTETDRARGIFGFGRRILVPADEIHVVVGHGRHILASDIKSTVYGQTADRSSRYFLNRLTQVIKLKTISFTVPIRGYDNGGVEALDSSKVSFKLWAHAVAKLDPAKAEIAAQRVGLDTMGLVQTITKVGEAELIAAAASMELENIIADRQKLAEHAFDKVNQVLSELGYDLALLTITNLDGDAYRKLVTQSESRISKETSIATNREQVAELQDDQARQQIEAEVQATTQKKLAAERLEAEREVETTTIAQQESLDISRYEMRLKQIGREKTTAVASQEAALNKLGLDRRIGEAEAEKLAELKRLETERNAELRALEQLRSAEINLAQTNAEAERLAIQQEREIERAMKLTSAEAQRLEQEEKAAAERQREIALIEANQLSEGMTVTAQAEASALKLRTESEAEAALLKAETEANAAEKEANAAKIRAEATRAEAAAPGLAEAQVDEARLQVAEQQVSVSRSEGLAAAEVARAQADAEADRLQKIKTVEIAAQEQLATLYEQAPVLVDLEKMRIQLDHQERLAQIRTDAQLKVVEALAPSMRVNIIGSGGQMSDVLNNVMTLTQGLGVVGEEVPFIGRLLDGNAPVITDSTSLTLAQKFGGLLPHVRQLLSGMNPRMISSLKVNDVVDQLATITNGDATLADAVSALKDDATFRVIGDMPVQPLLKLVGLDGGGGGSAETEPTLAELEASGEI